MTELAHTAETKSLGDDTAGAFDTFSRTFEAFREANDRRLSELETRGAADVLSEEKLARIDRALDEAKDRLDRLTLKSRRPHLAADEAKQEGGDGEHAAAFRAYMRGGDAGPLRRIEAKALSAGSGPDGGFLVPAPAEREVLARMAQISPIRRLASVRSIASATFKKAFSGTGPAAGWVAETGARAETATPTMTDLTFPAMELYAMPAATQTMLDDAAIDVEQWIAAEVETVFAEKEGQAFVNGDGTNKPRGFLAYTKVANASWTPEKTGYVISGAAGAFPASNPSDVLMDLIYALKAGYRQNASFVMNRATQATIRKFRDSQGHYLWQPPAMAGGDASLMGFPLVEAEDMPNVGADSFAVAFGDFRRGYLVVDRTGMRVLRDPYTAKPYVLFYTTKRVGGGIQDFEAIKLLKFGTA
jgi:HK97 family phage major capsid protein